MISPRRNKMPRARRNRFSIARDQLKCVCPNLDVVFGEVLMPSAGELQNVTIASPLLLGTGPKPLNRGFIGVPNCQSWNQIVASLKSIYTSKVTRDWSKAILYILTRYGTRHDAELDTCFSINARVLVRATGTT